MQAQIDANTSTAAKSYVTNLAASTLADINRIQLSPDISTAKTINVNGVMMSPKDVAVSNVVNAANANVQWASTFYNTPLPAISLTAPTGDTVIPGGTPTPPPPSPPAAVDIPPPPPPPNNNFTY
jgi:hypothetical protein